MVSDSGSDGARRVPIARAEGEDRVGRTGIHPPDLRPARVRPGAGIGEVEPQDGSARVEGAG